MQKLPEDAIYVFNNGLSIYKLKNKLKAGERFKLTNYRRTALIQKGVLHEHLSKCIPPEMTNSSTDIITNPRSMQQKRVIHIQNQLVRGVLSYQIEEILPNFNSQNGAQNVIQNAAILNGLLGKPEYYLCTVGQGAAEIILKNGSKLAKIGQFEPFFDSFFCDFDH